MEPRHDRAVWFYVVLEGLSHASFSQLVTVQKKKGPIFREGLF